MKLNFLSKFSILSISILLMSHLAISPVIPSLYELYHSQNPNIGLASVESLATLPAMMITIFVLISNIIINYIGKKNTIILGLVIIFIAGIIPSFTLNFNIVLISRLFLGAGIGLFNSLSISIISDYFSGETRNTMIGMRTAFLNIGKAITTFVAGYLLVYDIKYIFLVYSIALPIALIFSFAVPNAQAQKRKTIEIKIHKETITLTSLTFFIGICYMGATVKIPTLLSAKYSLSPDISRNILSVLAISGTFAGFLFGKFIKIFKDTTLIIMLTFMLLGQVIFAVTNNIFLFYLAAILIGISFVGAMSFNFYYIAKKLENKYINFATSIVLIGGNIGVILTPVVLTKLPEKLSLEPFVTPFYITSAIMLICTISSYLTLKNNS